MKGGVRIRTVRGDDGRTRVVDLAATLPFAAKLVGDTVFLVGAAAAPLDGDRIAFDLDIGAGTTLTVRTVAATMAWPGRGATGPSYIDVRATVGDGATLRWLPEPIVPVRRCRHVMRTEVEAAATSTLVWREEFVLGRANEGPGSLDAHTRIERAGAALLHQHLVIDGTRTATHRAASLLADARATGSVLVVGPGAPDHTATISEPDLRGAVLELEGGGRMAQATARSVARLRTWLDDREAGLTAGLDRPPPGAPDAGPGSAHDRPPLASPNP